MMRPKDSASPRRGARGQHSEPKVSGPAGHGLGFDRVTRRLLPLSSLLRLTLAFPDQAPFRFKVAMRTGTTVQVQAPPGVGGGISPAALLLTDQPPSSPSVYRTTLEDGAGIPDGQQRFRWDTGAWVRFTGTAGATLYVSGPSLLGLAGELVVDVELRHCTGDDCATLATRRATSPGPLLGLAYAAVSVNLGAIDAVLAVGDSLELVVTAPAATTRDLWLAHDATGTPSSFVFDPS